MATFDEVFKAAEAVVHYTTVSNLSKNVAKLADVLETYDGKGETDGVIWTARRLVASNVMQISGWVEVLNRALVTHRRENGV